MFGFYVFHNPNYSIIEEQNNILTTQKAQDIFINQLENTYNKLNNNN
jgi:hypothetical protein